MLKGCMEIFGKLYEKHGERLILDTYSPEERNVSSDSF